MLEAIAGLGDMRSGLHVALRCACRVTAHVVLEFGMLCDPKEHVLERRFRTL